MLADATIGVFGVPVYQDGTGAAGFYSGWEGSFPHAVPVNEAMARASTPGDPTVSIELVAATISPLDGGPATPFYPAYRAVRRSGAAVFVFQSGRTALETDVHPY